MPQAAQGWSRGVQNHSETRDVKKYFQRLIDKQSRKIMASGGIEQVMDGGGGKHSVFAKELLSALKENTSYLETYSLFDTVRKKVIPNSPQTPEYEIIFMGGDDGGEFVFVPGSLVN